MAPESKQQLRLYLLKLIDDNDPNFIIKTAQCFSVSKSSVYNYLNKLLTEKILVKKDGKYALTSQTTSFLYTCDGTLGEDRIFTKDIEPLLSHLPKNVLFAWRYAFTEMMNNAIEHAEATTIEVCVHKNELKTQIVILDNGIGIFNNIQEYIKRTKGIDFSPAECASLLFAGKFTTAESMHSGEGIFFTSHLMDSYYIISGNVVFCRNNFQDIPLELSASAINGSGTLVTMSLYNNSKKTTREVFDRFADVEEGFIKTHIPIAHFFPSGTPVSRSEARRLGEILLSFKEVTLDFTNVEEVGQAFVHELFVLWKNRNPEITLHIVNICENVDWMIRRVLNTK